MQLVSNDLPVVTGIYKVTCKATLKSYIGQARNIKMRIKQHLRSSINDAAKDYGVPFHAAIRKYGIENFDIEVLELCDAAELNDKERYWIKMLGTYIHAEGSGGYNVTEGGRQSVRRIKLTPEVLTQIFSLLKENILTYKEIADKFALNADTVKRLNTGRMCYDPRLSYPLRNNSTCVNKQKFGSYLYTGTAVEQLDRYTGNLLALYPSAFAAASALGNVEYNKHIAHCCSGKRKTAYGYKWKFRDISEAEWKSLF